MSGTQILFYAFAAMAVVGAVATVTRTNPVVAVMCLVGTFFALAGVYVTLHAHFIAVIQVLVYAGAIMVLFIFVVMLLGREESEPWWKQRGIATKVLGLGGIAYIGSRLVGVLMNYPHQAAEPPPTFGTVASIGRLLVTDYLFPFEAISVLLLVAIVGALVIASHHHEQPAAKHARSDAEHGHDELGHDARAMAHEVEG